MMVSPATSPLSAYFSPTSLTYPQRRLVIGALLADEKALRASATQALHWGAVMAFSTGDARSHHT